MDCKRCGSILLGPVERERGVCGACHLLKTRSGKDATGKEIEMKQFFFRFYQWIDEEWLICMQEASSSSVIWKCLSESEGWMKEYYSEMLLFLAMNG